MNVPPAQWRYVSPLPPPSLPAALFTALWKCLIPALKYLSLLVTHRKEAQTPPPLTASTQDVSCPELQWLNGNVGFINKNPGFLLTFCFCRVRIPLRNWQSSFQLLLLGESDIIVSPPPTHYNNILEYFWHLQFGLLAVNFKIKKIAPHFICTHCVYIKKKLISHHSML